MTEFCFESINWSPFFGHTRSSVLSLSEAGARAGFSWISFDEQLLYGVYSRLELEHR